jgi:anti-sigma factor RsiW
VWLSQVCPVGQGLEVLQAEVEHGLAPLAQSHPVTQPALSRTLVPPHQLQGGTTGQVPVEPPVPPEPPAPPSSGQHSMSLQVLPVGHGAEVPHGEVLQGSAPLAQR